MRLYRTHGDTIYVNHRMVNTPPCHALNYCAREVPYKRILSIKDETFCVVLRNTTYDMLLQQLYDGEKGITGIMQYDSAYYESGNMVCTILCNTVKYTLLYAVWQKRHTACNKVYFTA